MKLTILLLFLSLGVMAQSNRKTYSYKLNSSYHVGYNIEGVVTLKAVSKDWKHRQAYIIIVKGNVTSKIIIEQRAVFNLIREQEYIVLKNCKLLENK